MRALERRPLALPTAVLEPPPADSPLALVVPGFEQGALLLRGPANDLVRLSWEPEASAERRRGVPPGRYELVGYGLLARDERGVPWHVSAGGKVLRELELAAGTETRLDLDPTITLDADLMPDGLRVTVQGEAGAGLSIYRAGHRIPLSYRLRTFDGREAARGAFRYG